MINDGVNNHNQKQKQKSESKSEAKKRRSLSVSAAVSRKSKTPPPDIEELFSNKRDNPLFWSTGNSPTQLNPSSSAAAASTSSSSSSSSSSGNDSKGAGQRGRPLSRYSDHHLATAARSSTRPRSTSTSTSRVDIHGHSSNRSRGRSVSRHKYSPSSESEEVEQQQKPVSKASWNSSNSAHDQASSMKKPISSTPRGNANAAVDTLHFSRRSFRSQSRPDLHRTSHPSPSADSYISNREDDISTGSLSEAEEKTIKAVYEQIKSIQEDNLGGENSTSGIYETVRSEVRRAISDIHLDIETVIRRSKVAAIASANVTDFPPVLVKPGDVELVSGIRKEYSQKLGECQERAKKLRENLAVEEHRGQELTRILKETLPDPKTFTSRRSHKGRKTSSERKRMSKRLTDEAISYFDECVSISTFDSSDFSAAEDSAVNSVGTTHTSSLPQISPCISNSCGQESCPSHKQLKHNSSRDATLMANISCNEAIVDEARIGGESTRELSRKFQFSSINCVDNDDKAAMDSEISSGRCKNYDSKGAHGRESLLFDRILLRNRIQSGGLHLCGGGGGGLAISFLPFPSLI